jgi:hypothetical protein
MTRWISLAGVACGTLLLSACLLAPPEANQLEKMKEHGQKGDLQSNSREPLTCGSTAAECYQLHLLKGDACYTLAKRATDIATRRDLDTCAANDLHEGTTLASTEKTPVGDLHGYRLEQLEALRDLIDTRRRGDPPGADALATAAQDFRKHYASDPAGPFYLASARLTVAEDNFLGNPDAAALCTSLSDIDGISRTGNAAPGDLESQYRNLAKSIADLRRTGGCT